MKVANKVFTITGAGGGLGRELTLHLTNKGAKVAMIDLSEERLKESADLVKDQSLITYFVTNITDIEQVQKLPELIIQKFGTIDALINNAGIIQPFVNVTDLEYSTIERIMSINFFGTVYMSKTFLPYLLKRPEAHLTNVASEGGFIPFPGQTIYSASKAAVKIFTEGLYEELMGGTVKVTVIFPGAMNTNIAKNSGVNMGTDSNAPTPPSLDPAIAAAQIIDGIEQDKLYVYVGDDSVALDKAYRANPQVAIDGIVQQMAAMKK